MTSCEGLLRSGDGFGVWPREGSLRVARPAGADSRRREAGVLGGHADERRQRRCPAGRQPKGTPRPGRSALLRLLERAPPCRRRRASRPIPGRWRRARDPRGARPLARPKPRACLRNRPAAVGFAQPSVGREGANPFPARSVTGRTGRSGRKRHFHHGDAEGTKSKRCKIQARGGHRGTKYFGYEGLRR